jgi:hypothetical protein
VPWLPENGCTPGCLALKFHFLMMSRLKNLMKPLCHWNPDVDAPADVTREGEEF